MVEPIPDATVSNAIDGFAIFGGFPAHLESLALAGLMLLTAIGLGRDVNAHLKTMFEALGLHAKRPDPAESIPAPPISDPTRRSGLG